MVDITVRHEDGEYLPRVKSEYIWKYSSLLPQLKEQFETSSGEALPIVVGTRGAVLKFAIDNLKRLGIKIFGDWKTIS